MTEPEPYQVCLLPNPMHFHLELWILETKHKSVNAQTGGTYFFVPSAPEILPVKIPANTRQLVVAAQSSVTDCKIVTKIVVD
jgi:hypothetical protein